MTVLTYATSGNLPSEVSSFVRRDGTLTTVRASMSTARCTTLVGPGGIGKTRLALRLADELRGAYPDGVWVVELARVSDGDLVVRTISETLGVRDEGADPPLEVLADHLRNRHLLLVLDNCEHLVTRCAVVVHQLLSRSPHLRIVTTSRRRLGFLGEHVVHVPPLTTPPSEGLPVLAARAGRYEAMALFADRAYAADASFQLTEHNVAQVADLVMRLAGIPLAIELVAARIRSLPLRQIVDRLSELLTGGGPEAPARHRTLRATMQWSFDLCSPAEQVMWARLAVFRGSFDLAAAELVCAGDGIDKDQVLDLVTGLAEQSILTKVEDRYTQLAPIAEYGMELLRQSGEEERLRRRHAHWCRQMAVQAAGEWIGPNQLRWLTHLHDERDNLRSGLAYCLATPDHARWAMEIITGLMVWWTPTFGSFSEARDYLDRAMAMDPAPHSARAAGLWTAGWFALRHGDLTGAAELLAECRALAELLDDAPALVCCIHFEGLLAVFRNDGDGDGAVALLEEARERYTALGDDAGVWMSLCHLTMAAAAAGDHQAADAYGEQCLALAKQHHARLSRSSALWALGWGCWLRGEREHATALLREGLRIMREAGDAWGIAECLEVLAWLATDSGDDEGAAHLIGAAQHTWHLIGISVPGLRTLADQHGRCTALLRGRMGEEAYNAAVRAGAEQEDAAATEAKGPAPGHQQPAGDNAVHFTRRELDVARLLADGRSNRDIAKALFISVRTAETHVSHILSKLGASSRTEAAKQISSSGIAGSLTEGAQRRLQISA